MFALWIFNEMKFILANLFHPQDKEQEDDDSLVSKFDSTVLLKGYWTHKSFSKIKTREQRNHTLKINFISHLSTSISFQQSYFKLRYFQEASKQSNISSESL